VRRTTRRSLVATLVLVTALSGTAFADTFGTTMEWQQRTDVAVSVGEITMSEDGSTVSVSVTVHNELARDIEVLRAVVGVYAGTPEKADESLSVPHGTRVPITTIPANGEANVTLTADVFDDHEAELRERVENGTATPSGSLMIEIRDERFNVDVPT
jgi:hypothetical protein